MQIESLLATHWQLSADAIIPHGPVWQIRTKAGDYCLKRGKHGKQYLLFDYEAIESLWNNGFCGTPRFIETVQGTPFAETAEGLFVLTDWVGRTLNAKSNDEWKAAAAKLALFHKASLGLVLQEGLKPVSFKGKWPKRLTERTAELKQLLKTFDKNQNKFEKAVLQDAPLILQHAEGALQMLEASSYPELVKKLEERPTLVHGNVKAENFTRDEKGRICLIDFDAFRIDVTVQDVSDFFANALPAQNWSQEHAKDWFDAYHSIKPITSAEAPILLALLQFPHKVYTAVYKYAQGGRPLEKSLRKWQAAQTEMKRKHEFLPNWASWVQNRVE